MAFTCRLCKINGDQRSEFIYLFDKSNTATENLNFMTTELNFKITPNDRITKFICLKCSIMNDHFSRYLTTCQEIQEGLFKRAFEANLLRLRETAITTNICASLSTTSTNVVNIDEGTQTCGEVKPKYHGDIIVIDDDDDDDEDANQFENAENNSVDVNETPTANNDPVPTLNTIDKESKTGGPSHSDKPMVHGDVGSVHEKAGRKSAAECVLLPQKQVFLCKICMIDMQNRKALGNHWRHDHQEVPLFCLLCDYVTLIKDELNQHVKECHKKNLTCGACHAQFRLHSMLSTHFTDMHTDCTLCDETFNQKYKSQKHERSIHFVNGHWVCYICTQPFGQSNLLELHMIEIHNINKRIKGPVDGCSFFTHKKNHLVEHKQKVHKKKFNCPHCGKSDKELSNIEDHIRRKHQAEEGRRCQKCKQIFKTNRCFDRHTKANLCAVKI